MFYLPRPKNMDILEIPDESNNIEDYLEFYLSLNYGFSDIIVEPIKKELFIKTIDKYLE